MDPSKLYVPDPQKWVKFYKHLADGKINHYSINQIGEGENNQSPILTVDKYIDQSENKSTKQPALKLVSTTEQIVDQAKSELKREGEDLKMISRQLKSHNSKSKRKKRMGTKLKRLGKQKQAKRRIKTKKTTKRSTKPKRARKGALKRNRFSSSKTKKLNYITKDIFGS